MTRTGQPAPAAAARLVVPALAIVAICVSALSTARAQQTFTGVITDDMCAERGHQHMRMGPNDAECTKACVAAHGAEYVLLDGKTVYRLSDQNRPEAYAAQRVRIVGALDAKTRVIRVDSIAAAK
jgi:hypothetical protein